MNFNDFYGRVRAQQSDLVECWRELYRLARLGNDLAKEWNDACPDLPVPIFDPYTAAPDDVGPGGGDSR